MKHSLVWRGLLIAAVVAMAGYTVYPPRETISLGLDLQGGVHMVLQVQTEDALRAERDKDMDRLLRELEDAGIEGVEARESQIEAGDVEAPDDSRDPNRFRLLGVEPAADEQVGDIVDEFELAWDTRREGDELVFERDAAEVSRVREQAIRQALQTIRNRVDEFGVAEPAIHRQGLGSNRIVVQLPGVDDPERVKDLIKSTAFLEFRLVDYPPPDQVAFDREEILAHYSGRLPETVEIFTEDVRNDAGRRTGQRFYAVERRRVITGRDLKSARPGRGQFNEPVVNFNLTPEGARLFGKATGDNVGRALAIILDGKVMSAPRINDRITDSGLIEGAFTQSEVEDLSTVLSSGALPAGITVLEERAVGPTLGQDSIDQGLRAGLAGAVLVVLTMLVVYKLTGINAVVALGLNFVLVFGALAYFGATLTLPGIAGIILTIGMAVDANVLVFERIREELHHGRTVKSAVGAGFQKALSSILDANVTTLIAAMFLFQFGTGPVRGFAVTLSVGILASVFTAVICSRLIFDLVLSRPGRVDRLSI
jgi:preprotein translocase subunit SecD